MLVHVDQTWRQRAPAAIDDGRVGVGLNVSLGNFLDEIAFDEDTYAFGNCVALAVKDVDVGEQNLRLGLLFSRYG